MRILALESSSRAASVALSEDDIVVQYEELSPEIGTAQGLAPSIKRLFSAVHWTIDSLDLIVVSIGPGSFTGLRVGVTTAKTLAYATGASLIGLNSLEVVACQAPQSCHSLAVVLDAQRNQVYFSRFRREDGVLRNFEEPQIVDELEWLEGLDGDVWVTGPALSKLGRRLSHSVNVVADEHWVPKASTVGQLGHRMYLTGHRDDLWSLAPQYYRPSAAEEKLTSRPDVPPS